MQYNDLLGYGFWQVTQSTNPEFPTYGENGDSNNCPYIIRLLWELIELFYTKDLVPRDLPVAIIFIIAIAIWVFQETVILLKEGVWHINS